MTITIPPSFKPNPPALNRFQQRLEERLLEVLKSNPSADAPYHNNRHMKMMWVIAQVLWEAESVGLPPDQLDWGLETLMFACLLHDYDHSAGKDNDHYNVLRAREFVSELIGRHGYSLPGNVIHDIDSAIACTQYPFVKEPCSVLERVVRDADVLYATLSNDPTVLMEDLRTEIGTAAGRYIPYDEMLSGQINFASNVTLYTAMGKTLFDAFSPWYIKRLEQYIHSKGNPDV